MTIELYLERPRPEEVKVERVDRKEDKLSNVLLYRGWKDDGEHSEEYCVELQFKDKKTALSWLKRKKINYQEIADHQELPWITIE